MEHISVSGHRDFRRLWLGLSISQLGSAIGGVALPIVAIRVVPAGRAGQIEISALAFAAAVTVALVAFPLGAYVEFHTKRPVMIASDLARCAAAASVPVVAYFHALTFAQLAVVAVVNATGQVGFQAAAGANLRGVVPRDMLVDANSRLQASQWAALTTGASVAGGIIALVGAPVTLLVDAVSFVVDAIVIRTLREPETTPAHLIPAQRTAPGAGTSTGRRNRRADLAGGLRFVAGHATLRPVLASWVLFVGAMAMCTPVYIVFYQRELHFSELEYGLLMGVPSLGGFLGSRIARRVAMRLDPVGGMWWASLARTPWYFIAPLFATPGLGGLIVCGVAFGGGLVFSSLSNALQSAYRQLATPESLQARVTTLWIFVPVVTTPLFIALGAGLAAWLSTRPTLIVGAALAAVSVVMLPRRERVPKITADQPDAEVVSPA